MPEKTKSELENHDELLSQQSGEEIDRLLAESEKVTESDSELLKARNDDLLESVNVAVEPTEQEINQNLENARIDGTPEISVIEQFHNEIVAEKENTIKSAKEIMDSPLDQTVDSSLSSETNTFQAPASPAGVEEVALVPESAIVPEPLPDAPSLVPEFAADHISSTPVESGGVATGVGLEIPDAQPVAVEKTPPKETEAELLAQTDEILEKSGKVLDYSRSVIGKPEDGKPSFAFVSPMGATGIPPEAYKKRDVVVTRTEPIASAAAAENFVVDDTKEDNREAPQGLADAVAEFNSKPRENPTPRVESGKSRLDKLMDAIGNPNLTKYSMDAVPLSAVETPEEHKTRVAHERHVAGYHEMQAPRDRVYLRPIQKFIDRFYVGQTEKRIAEASLTEASLTKRLENDGKRTVEIDNELKSTAEKIEQLFRDPNLNENEKSTLRKRFEAQRASLSAEQAKLKVSIETATADHAWVSGQMKSFETYRGKVVENITRRNEERLAPLKEQSELVDTEINNFRNQIESQRSYIRELNAKKAELANDLDKKGLRMYDDKVARANKEIESLKKQLSRRIINAGDVGEKINKLEIETNKFKDIDSKKPSDRHDDLDRTLPDSPVTPGSSGGGYSERPSSDYESTDDETETETEAPEIKKKKPAFKTAPTANPEEIAETAKDLPFISGQKIENSVFPETPQTKEAPQTPPSAALNASVEKSAENKIKKPERKKSLISQVRVKLKKLGFDNKFIGQYVTLYGKTRWTKETKMKFDRMKKEVDDKDRIVKEVGKK